MRQLTIIFILLGSLGLSGCVSWPSKGQGGMAEHNPVILSPAMPDQPLGPEHGLRFDLDLVQRHLDVLVLEGAELCFPATVVQARQRQNRIARELQGGLDFDAANDLIVQRKLLARLERQLDYVRQQQVCILPVTAAQERPGDMGKRIHDLLNSDNQFAFNSPELNPKYVGRLAEAAQLLLVHPGYQLKVTGHADARGTESHNRDLSMARARKVGRYLQIFGLEPERIKIDAVGSDSPLFDGKEPQVRLTNRRVSIELIEAANSTQPIGD
ncbi:MAG: OmpA family protein [Gammaproteobacteria bacterium]|nr:OmpA family protein [Gammaproteobacteria bacterium]